MEEPPNTRDEGFAEKESEKEVNRDADFDVFWDGENDPENPMNWSAARRWLIVGMVSFITFLT